MYNFSSTSRRFVFSNFLVLSRPKHRVPRYPRQNMPLFEERRRHSTKEPRENIFNMPGETCVLRYKKLTEKAYEPSKGSDYAAGYDLRSAYNYTIKAHGKELVKTDLQIQVPSGCYGRIAPRSGLAWKNFIDVGAGVIDIDYRGNINVLIYNHGDNDFVINEGDRIAQFICERIAYPTLEEVSSLDETKRGHGGFGSSGIN